MFKQTKKRPAQLQFPPVAEEIRYLYDRWREVHDGEPLTFQKVHVYDQVMSYGMESWEFKVLFAIDQAYWKIKESANGN